ncbi:MAG: patatin-like phospholipase family protein [Anaerolineaceae bacterium]
MNEIAVALGGGGIRGIAHIGVLKKLQEIGYSIKAVTGTSAGGLVGAVFASGFSPEEIEDIIYNVNQKAFFSLSSSDVPSLLSLQGLTKMLTELLGDRMFDSLKIPFACTAVDLETAQEIIINQGRVIEAALATAAFPGVFPPIKLGECTLVDGGVLDPVPVALARWLAPSIPVVAVCLSPEPQRWGHLPAFSVPPVVPIPHVIMDQVSHSKYLQAFQVFYRSMDVISRSLAELRMQIDKPDVILRPDVENIGLLDNVDPQELIQSGEAIVMASLEQIRLKLSWRSRLFRKFQHPEPPGIPISSMIKNPKESLT